jgi:membrane associated rhomboid family serine protease
MNITLTIIIITSLISVMAFQNHEIIRKAVFSPYAVIHNREWYRFVTSGFLHANWMHLILNMFVLYSFGNYAESAFSFLFPTFGKFLFLAMYILAIPVSETYSFIKHQNNYGYHSLGASGAVSAVLFSSILFMPWAEIGIIFIPIGIPAFIFGPLYLAYSAYMAKQESDNIGHDAHFYGAVFGFVFPLLFKPSLIQYFFESIVAGN